VATRFVSGGDWSPFNAYSWAGLIVVQTLKLTGFCYLLLLGPFESMNRSFEEASLIAGAGRLGTVFRIDIPLMTPALFGVVIIGTVFGLGTFDIPQILGGLPQISVLSTEIFKAVNFSVPPDYARASALALFMVAALAVLLAVQWRVVKLGRFVTVTGKGYKQDRWDIGRWSAVGTAAIVAYALVSLVLPVTQLVLTAFQPTIGIWDMTLKNFQAVLGDRQTLGAFRTTAELAILGGFIAMSLAMLIGHVGRRSGKWLERYLETATLSPIVMPGVVLAIGLMWAYVSIPGLRRLYATFWLTLIGLVVVVMPIASRAVRGALAQLARELEEAAAVSVASSARVLVDIVLRLTSRSFAAGWLVTAVLAAGSLDVPLMLLPSTRPNVAVLVYTHIISGVPTQASALLVLLLAAIVGMALLYVALSGLVGLVSRLRVRSAYRAA
jgi:iron(III) transport system permease protein